MKHKERRSYLQSGAQGGSAMKRKLGGLKIASLVVFSAVITHIPATPQRTRDPALATPHANPAQNDSEEARSATTSDIPRKFTVPLADYDYVKREEMITMRDGVKLFTVIIVPRGASKAPILLTRTPYNASKRVTRNDSPHMLAALPQGDDAFASGD